MEEEIISYDNLDAIEYNLENVGRELSGVIENVNTVNSKINNIEENISNLNNELSNMVKEIRETTIINNARQSIMYNNDQIEKKYGYHDAVRRTAESFLTNLNSLNISKKALLKTRDNLLLNNPNYWLSNALMTLIYWLTNDEENTMKELSNSMQKNKEKTSAFLCLINLKVGRTDTAMNWLKNYLSNEDPTNLSHDFIAFLDLVSNNEFGIEGKEIIIDKINYWIRQLSSNNSIIESEINKWINYIKARENTNINLQVLDILSDESPILKNNLKITSSYKTVTNELQNIVREHYQNKALDSIMNNLIYDYEEEEGTFKKDNLKNKLIIEHDGNMEEALAKYDQEKTVLEDNVNILSLLSNVVIYSSRYKVNNETVKLALTLIKNIILTAYDRVNSEINRNNYNISIEDFNIEITNITSNNEIIEKIDRHINNKYPINNQKEYTVLGIANLILIFLFFLLLKQPLLIGILLIALVVFDIYLYYNFIYKNKKIINAKKKEDKEKLLYAMEKGYAASVDYKNILMQNEGEYEQLKMFLNGLDIKNYIKSNNERSIDINE